MVEMNAVYVGKKHCELTHAPSGTRIETDAPKDNQGLGEKFSPTDLMGAALASCMLTTIAIKLEPEGIQIQGAKARVLKEMNAAPRRIARLPVEITLPKGIRMEDRKRLEEIAHTCPVRHSLAATIEVPIQFIYLD